MALNEHSFFSRSDADRRGLVVGFGRKPKPAESNLHWHLPILQSIRVLWDGTKTTISIHPFFLEKVREEGTK
jgi:hypothetical protein